jgi:shikimate dehydrogenase
MVRLKRRGWKKSWGYLKMDRADKSYMSNTTYRTNKESDSGKTKIFAVTGNPVLHSRSPDIFNAAFSLLSIDAVYTRFAASRVEEILAGVSDIGLSGFNVTSPFKEEIVPFLDNIDEAAQRVGAVNTIIVKNSRLHGFNTDIKGVKNTFSFNGVKTEGKRVLVLGAGGAAKSAVCALLSEGADVIIVNRTFEKARAISGDLGCKVTKMESIDKTLEHTDILISCLSSAERIIKPDSLKEGMVILDANYSVPTALVKDGKERGCTIIDGREWLLFQGMAAFRYFTGAEPPMESMREAVYKGNKSTRKNIALIGFMGTGKSTIARGITELTAMPCVDIDVLIEQKNGLSITGIFESKGEQAFRQMERKEIAGIGNLSKTIISCGGGAILSGENRDMLRKSSIVIWLWANVDTILERVGNDNGRPLLRNLREKSDVKSMLDERIPLYAQASDMLVNTDGLGPDEIVRKIYEETDKLLKN